MWIGRHETRLWMTRRESGAAPRFVLRDWGRAGSTMEARSWGSRPLRFGSMGEARRQWKGMRRYEQSSSAVAGESVRDDAGVVDCLGFRRGIAGAV